MANGNAAAKKPDIKVAKGALAGAAAAFANSDKSYRAEETFRDALKSAKKAGCSDKDCESIIGSAVVSTVDRYGDSPRMVGAEEPEPRGLERTIQKLSSDHSRHFVAGFASGLSGEIQKEGEAKKE